MIYTGGKWKYDNTTGEIQSVLLGDTGFVKICDVTPQDSMARMVGNANLIAAAPDMYEALRRATEIVSDMVIKYGAGVIPNETPVIKKFKKALAKAEGVGK